VENPLIFGRWPSMKRLLNEPKRSGQGWAEFGGKPANTKKPITNTISTKPGRDGSPDQRPSSSASTSR
jgi:hypothetical protein